MTPRIRELTESFVARRDAADEHERLASAAKTEAEAIEQELYRELLREGVSSLHFDDLGLKVVATVRSYPRVRPEAKAREDEIFDWLRAQGHGDVIREQVNPQTMKVTLRALADEGVTLPDWCENFQKTGVQIRRSS